MSGLRARLLLAVAGAVAAAALAGGAVLDALARRDASRAFDAASSRAVEEVRAVARESALAKDPLMLVDRLAEFKARRPEIVDARVDFGRGWTAIGTPAPSGTAAESVALSADGARVELRLSRAPFDAEARAALGGARRDLALAALIAFAVGWGLVSTLKVTRRLAEVERQLLALGEGREPPTIDPRDDELGRLSRAVATLSRRLREADEMKRTFVASVTHELRSPLAAIESRVRLMLDAPDLSPESRESLERVLAGVARLSRFATVLLDLARVERGRLDYRPRVGDLRATVEDAAAFLKPRAEENGQTLSFSAEDGLPALSFDPDLVIQIVTNLVENAVKFSPRGGAVAVRVERAGPGVRVAVTDRGAGVPPAARERLFRPFERAPGTTAPGSGLGLALCRAMVERHGGTIGLEDAPGGGSRFWFVLPLNEIAMAPNGSGATLKR